MTVAELMELLKTMDQNAVVMIDGFDGYAHSKVEKDNIRSGQMRRLRDSRWEIYEFTTYRPDDFEGDEFPAVAIK